MIEIKVKLNSLNCPISLNKMLNMHHMQRHKRNKALAHAIGMAFIEKGRRVQARKILETCDESHKEENGATVKKTLLVTICYVHPWGFDKANLAGALKSAEDAIADNLIPGLAPGRADGDPRLQFEFKQRKGTVAHEYALEIQMQVIKITVPMGANLIEPVATNCN